MALNLETPKGVEILGPDHPGIEKILTKECLAFVAELEREFKRERLGVLQERLRKQFDLDNGALPDFLEETKSIRESDWKVASIPNDLLDRQVEITGPVEGLRKININQKDSLILTYQFYAGSSLPTNALMNAVPMAIGTSAGAGREANVLEPDPADPQSTANSETTR